MLALLAACLWLAGCSGDGPDGGSGNLNIYGHEIEMYTVEQGEKRDKRQ